MNYYYIEVLDPENILPKPIRDRNTTDAKTALEIYESTIGKVLAGIAREKENATSTNPIFETDFDILPAFDFKGEDFLERVDFYPTLNGAPIAGSLVRIVFYVEKY